MPLAVTLCMLECNVEQAVLQNTKTLRGLFVGQFMMAGWWC